MNPQKLHVVSNQYIYGQSNPLRVSASPRAAKSNPAGGKTLVIIVGVIGVSIFIGMILAIGLGVGAAGLISDLNFINVTNSSA